MKLFDAADMLFADGHEMKLEELVSKMGADPLLVSKCEMKQRDRQDNKSQLGS